MTEPADPPPPTQPLPAPPWEPPGQWEPIPEPAPPSGPGFIRENWLSLTACALGVIAIVIALIALSYGSSDSGTSATAGGAPSTSVSPAASSPVAGGAARGAGGSAARAARATRATIVSESGPTWTVRTAKGQTLTVEITAQTAFGSPKVPATESQFPVGTQVVITGTLDNGTATATRVMAPKAVAPTVGASPSASQSSTES